MSQNHYQDWDPKSDTVLRDPRAAFDEMRERCPIAHSDLLGWSLFRHTDVVRVLNEPETFSSVVSRNLSVPNGMDVPEHGQYRRLIEPYFTPQALKAFEPKCRIIATELVRTLGGRLELELMTDFALQFAVRVQCAFLGWPSSMHEPLRLWAQKNQTATFAQDRPAMAKIAQEFSGYVNELLRHRAAEVTDNQDVAAHLANQKIKDRTLNDEEIVSILRNWTVGEISTIASAVGIVAQYLAEHADLQQQLRSQPDKLPDAIEEILRLYGPLLANRRVTTRAVEIGGHTIAAGERISLNWVAVNRDGRVFKDPQSFRLDRDVGANLLYGAGIHVCPGAGLARMELRVALQALLDGTEAINAIPQHPPTHAVYPASGFATMPLRMTYAVQPTHLRTRAVHAGQHPDPSCGAIATPICQTTAFGYGTLEHGAAIFAGEALGYRYSRFANPTVAALEAKMADLEGAQAAVAFSSGTAATSSVLLGLLNPGDEVAFLGPLYGGTEALFRSLGERFGIRVVDATQLGLAASVSPSTRMVWVETLTNPSLRLHDLAEVALIAKAHGVLTVTDNTFCTPWLVRPLELGIDLVMHSMTKYLGGHGDATGGIVAGSAALVATVRQTGLGHVGGNLSPQEAFLFLRGIKTLPLRMAAHCDGGMAVAQFLSGHSAVRTVHYPGLASQSQYALALRQMQGGFGGMVTFELLRNERAAAAAVLNRLELFTQAVSLGDVDSLACHPATTTHSFVTAEARVKNGITEGLIRLSVGIEHPDDLIADLNRALNQAA